MADGGASGLDILALSLGQVAGLEQPRHEKLQTSPSRQSTSRRVRRMQQAQILQVRHHIADSGRRQLSFQPARQRAGANRLSGLHIGIDDQPQYFARPLIQIRE